MARVLLALSPSLTPSALSYDNVFFGLPPAQRMGRRVRADLLPIPTSRPVKRVDGLGDVYRAYCVLQKASPRLDIVWDVDNIWALNQETVFDPREFESPLETKDLVALFRALTINMSFRRLQLRKMRMDREAAVAAAEVFAHNSEIRTLLVADCAPNASLMIPSLAACMTTNASLALSTLLLPNNTLDDKDLVTLAGGLGSMTHGLVELDLSGNAFGKKGLGALVQAFQKNNRTSQTLLRLNLSQCKIGTDGSSLLGGWLAAPNVLQALLLRDTSANVQHVAGGLARGAVELRTLDLALNKALKGGSSQANLVGLFSIATKLEHVCLASMALLPPQLKELVRALRSNSALEALELDVSDNGLGVLGANMLAIELGGWGALVALKAAGNTFTDKGMAMVVEAMHGCPALRRLDLSDNFDYASFRKSKVGVSLFADALGELLMVPTCALSDLRVAATDRALQMRLELIPLLMDLATNQSITALDVSGQGLEYSGCVAVSKMLQMNKHLQRLVMDDNGIDLPSLRALQSGIARNPTLTEMPLPINDLSLLLTKTDVLGRAEIGGVWTSIEETLHRNRCVWEGWCDGARLLKESVGRLVGPKSRCPLLGRTCFRAAERCLWETNSWRHFATLCASWSRSAGSRSRPSKSC